MRRLTTAMCAIALLLPAAAASDAPSCYGAAARDPEVPCSNPDLRYSVEPTPAEARTAPYSPCSLEPGEPIDVCAFGVPADQAKATIALLGDSHASHWRAAFETVMPAYSWRGVSITHSGCPYSSLVRKYRRPLQGRCVAWKRQVAPWFRRHPEIHTVFVVQDAGQPFILPPHVQAFKAQVRGFESAWRGLPATVTRIFVIRDTPKDRPGTAACVERAISAHQEAGQVCAVPRRTALERDAQFAAGIRLRSARVRVLDFTRFFCDTSRCYPVIGGVLVHKDEHHLTAAYARTLGPYLLRTLQRVSGP